MSITVLGRVPLESVAEGEVFVLVGETVPQVIVDKPPPDSSANVRVLIGSLSGPSSRRWVDRGTLVVVKNPVSRTDRGAR